MLIVLGVPQTLAPFVNATTLEGAKQLIPAGPVAFMEAIKMLGTNGGGFFNANSAHPFENPNAWTNLIELWSIVGIPFALCVTFGRIVGDFRQGRALFVDHGHAWSSSPIVICYCRRGRRPIPLLTALGVDPSMGNMEGKEVRFGTAMSSIWAVLTTGASNGSVNSMHDSFMPIGGLVPLFMIQLGEVLPGGVGSGIYGIVVFALLAVFVAGLMVGRTPEYLGKKIKAREIKLAMLAVLILPIAILGGAALSLVLPDGGRPRSPTAGPHGLSEMLYAYTSADRQQRQRLRGPHRRHAVARHDARHRHAARPLCLRWCRCWRSPDRSRPSRSFPKAPAPSRRTGGLFIGLLIGVILILGGLQFLPALSLGPIAEHFSLILAGKTY